MEEIVKKSDFNITNSVVQANDLVQKTNGTLNGVPLKLFKAFISCIDVDEPPVDNKVYMKKNDLLDFFNESSKGAYSYFKAQMMELRRYTTIIRTGTENRVVGVVDEISWKDDDPMIMCKFSDAIREYLVDLRKLFLQYPIGNLKSLNSKYSIILYEYLLSRARQYQKEMKDLKIKPIEIELEDLRILVGTTAFDDLGKKIVTEKYKVFADFERKVIITAVNEINNAGVEFLIESYEKKRSGKKVGSIVFNLRVRTSFMDTQDHVEYPERLDSAI